VRARQKNGITMTNARAHNEMADEPHSDLVKVTVNLPPHAWHGYRAETLWAEPLGDNLCRIENVPFHAYGISADDVVAADEREGELVFRRVVERSGHSTYRVFLREGVTEESPRFRALWQRLERLGCSYEGATERLLAIDVPPSADISDVYEILSTGEQEGVWDFEEGHCGHALTGSEP
jgi:hypothetical protein